MIKISNSVLVNNDENVLSGIAKFHYNRINPISKNTRKPLPNAIINRLIEAKDTINGKDYLDTHCLGNLIKQSRHISFFDYFINEDMTKIKDVILAKPENLQSIIDDINGITTPTDWFENNKYTEFYKIVEQKVFTYNNYRKSKGCFNVYNKLIQSNTQCFYCNCIELEILLSTKNKLLFDLDHFYLKSKYPYLSLSFYNLIPCCSVCNSRVRSVDNFACATHINPYSDSFNSNYIFELNDDELFKLGMGADTPFTTVSLKIRSNSSRQNDQTGKDLELEARYIRKIGIINKLAVSYRKNKHKKKGFMDDYIEIIHGDSYSNIPIDESQIPIVPLSKLKMDVLAQIDKDKN